MPIDPATVRAQQFRVVFRGYDVDEVDDFLDRIEEELTRLSGAPSPDREAPAGGLPTRWLHAVPARPLPAPAHAARPEVEATAEEDAASSRAQRTLDLAERMAEQLIAEATAEAAAIRGQGQAEAAATRGRAQAEAAALLADARAEAAHIVGAAQLRLQQVIDHLAAGGSRLWAELDRLREQERRCREELQAGLDDQGRLTDPGPPLAVTDPRPPLTVAATRSDGARPGTTVVQRVATTLPLQLPAVR